MRWRLSMQGGTRLSVAPGMATCDKQPPPKTAQLDVGPALSWHLSASPPPLQVARGSVAKPCVMHLGTCQEAAGHACSSLAPPGPLWLHRRNRITACRSGGAPRVDPFTCTEPGVSRDCARLTQKLQRRVKGRCSSHFRQPGLSGRRTAQQALHQGREAAGHAPAGPACASLAPPGRVRHICCARQRALCDQRVGRSKPRRSAALSSRHLNCRGGRASLLCCRV